MRRYFVAMLWVLCVLGQTAHAQEEANDYVYRVKQGDTLSRLAQEVLDRPSRWADVAKYNKLPNGHLIHPGEELHMQFAWLKNYPAEARIESVSGEVLLNGKAAKVGDAVPNGAVVKTSKGAFARMVLPDGSTMNMSENTNIEATKLEQKKQGSYFNATFRLVSGRIDAVKQKYAEGQAPLLIRARNATIGIRGTHFRFGQEDSNTKLEVENGLVGLEAEKKGESLAVGGGYGTVADGVSTPQLIPLLLAPKYPALPVEFQRQTVRFTMPGLSGAQGYRGEVARDAEFSRIVAAVSAPGDLIKIGGLADGNYWMRLRGVDEHGLQGMEAKTPFVVKLRPYKVMPNMPEFESDKLLVRWGGEAGARYEFQIASGNDFAFPLVSLVTRESHLDLPRPESGRYFMRLRPTDSEGERGEWSAPLAFTVP
ncbi:MAG: FecR domain-containing protein [Gallionella sp.]|nr:FecR domain-containing protein [Gallionella sp.]